MDIGIDHEIIQPLAVLSETLMYTKEVNLISWNGAEPVVDIRRWKGRKALKGITVTLDEAKILAAALSDLK